MICKLKTVEYHCFKFILFEFFTHNKKWINNIVTNNLKIKQVQLMFLMILRKVNTHKMFDIVLRTFFILLNLFIDILRSAKYIKQ